MTDTPLCPNCQGTGHETIGRITLECGCFGSTPPHR